MLSNIFSALNIVTVLALFVAVSSKPTRDFRNRRIGDLDPRGFAEHKPLKQFNIRTHTKRRDPDNFPTISAAPKATAFAIPGKANNNEQLATLSGTASDMTESNLPISSTSPTGTGTISANGLQENSVVLDEFNDGLTGTMTISLQNV